MGADRQSNFKKQTTQYPFRNKIFINLVHMPSVHQELVLVLSVLNLYTQTIIIQINSKI